MKKKTRSLMYSLTILTVLALSAYWTVPAFADDGTPPPTEIPAAETPPVEEVTEMAPPAEEVAPVLDEVTVPASVPAEETVAELFASVPEGTELVVTDGDGQALPLVTEEAAQAIFEGDPLWCPVGVTPIANIGGCSPSFTTFTDNPDPDSGLLAWLAGQAGKAGVIWVAALYDSSNEVGPISLSMVNMANFALTINGGWTGGTILNPNTPSTFNVPLSIDWNAAVTLNNILVGGASGAGAYALEVSTAANTITLNNVDVQDNTTGNGGAFLHNVYGAGNVIVNDSTFNGNSGGDGLRIHSAGTVSGKNLSAIGNGGSGVYIDNSNVLIVKAVTLTGSNQFSYNGGDGLMVYSDGAITLSNITAIYNIDGSGAYLDNCLGFDGEQFCYNGAASVVTLKGVNNFSHNGWDGLRVWSPGIISVNSVTANDNGSSASRPAADSVVDDYQNADQYDGYGKGAFLNNRGAWSIRVINLTGTNIFNNNAGNGLFAFGGYGTLKVNNLTANENGCDLSYDITDYYCAGAYLDAHGVTLTGYGTFLNNDLLGLQVHSFSTAIILNNLHAELNGAGGVYVVMNGGKPAALSILGNNFFNENLGDGLAIYSMGGMVSLSNITANLNNGNGIYVDNRWKWELITATLIPAGAAVTLSGTNSFNDNGYIGLEIHSSGVITTNVVTALSNGSGVYLENCLVDNTDPDPFYWFCTGLPGKAITMNGSNNINFNFGDGLHITSLGAIKVNNLSASVNNGNGAILDNDDTSAIGGVAVTGFANTSWNGIRGLGIYSRGGVLTSNLTANDNGPGVALSGEEYYDGAYINNAADPTKLMNVTLLGLNQFNGNWNTGLQIISYGTVILNNIKANNNGEPYDGTNNPTPEGDGTNVNTSGSPLAKAVLNGINTFNGNLDDGLFVATKGAILVNKVTANFNTGRGAWLGNQWDLFTTPITMLGYGVFNENQAGGLMIYSNGAVITNMLTANNNIGGMGVYIDNKNNLLTTSFVSVTMNGINTFNGNADDGLYVYSDGVITINNVTANDNGGDGAYLDNMFYASVLKNIIVNGSNTFVNNGMSGLEFVASGAVTMTRIISDLNNEGITGTALTSITLTCGSLTFNTGAGYNLTSGALITLKGLFTYGNGAPNGGVAVITRTCPLP